MYACIFLREFLRTESLLFLFIMNRFSAISRLVKPCLRQSKIIRRCSDDIRAVKRCLPLATQDRGFLNSNSYYYGVINWNSCLDRYFHSLHENIVSHQKQQVRTFLSCGDGDEDSGLAKTYEEKRVVGYSPEQLFSVVAAVDLYEDFIPWCQKSKILQWKDNESFDAELEIGFRFFVERYISHVELKKPNHIKTTVSESNIFDYLINIWEFKNGPVPGTCDLHFFVDFQFRSPLYRQVAHMFFKEVVSRLVQSFEERCQTVYGPAVKVLEDAYGSQRT